MNKLPTPLLSLSEGVLKLKEFNLKVMPLPASHKKVNPKAVVISVLFCVMLGLPQDRKEPHTPQHNHGNPLAPNVLSHERAKRNILSFLGSFFFLEV